jgi:tetratricopeptide (TPR) repeat protein
METCCTECGNRFKVNPQLVGKKGRCDRCKAVFVIGKAEPLPRSNLLPTIVLAVAGLGIVGFGVSMLGGSTDPGTGNPGVKNNGGGGKGGPNAGLIKPGQIDPGGTSTANPNGTPKNGGGGRDDPTAGPKDPTKNGENSDEKAVPEELDQKVQHWSLKPSPVSTQKEALKLGMISLVGDTKVVINGRSSLFKVPFDNFPLYLPQGVHEISQGSARETVHVTESYADRYTKERSRLTTNKGTIDFVALVKQKTNEMEHPQEAFLLNLAAHHYLKNKRYKAAKRILKRCLAQDPTFPPAHLNLAWVLCELKEKDAAINELRLAEDLDSQGTFGLERGFALLRRNLSIRHERKKVVLKPEDYQFKFSADDAVVEACMLFARLAKTPLDVISAHNNAGLRLLKLGQYEQAYGVFMRTLKMLSKCAPTKRGRLVAATLFANLGRLYEAANWSEKMEMAIIRQVFPQ